MRWNACAKTTSACWKKAQSNRIKISSADALNTLNRIATKVDAMLAKQIEHYRDILQANQKQGKEESQ